MATDTAPRLGMWGLIASDLRAKARWMYQSDSAGGIIKTLLADGTVTMLLYRVMQASQRLHLSPIAMICNRINAIFGQAVIGRGADFGPAFVILYSNGITINSMVKGGSNVTLAHQITLGEERQKAPQIGDHVYIGAGARISGPITIGNHVKIGANSVVTGNVPDGVTMFGIPAKVVWRTAVPK